ncbi:PASTA domain-containing protein [Streptomyces galilaeus]|uniref:PASTA domain-containing protein n=1 Tax=Streptomyces galilaeus TaxID=33899 RepID=A0ABW9IUU7_STRGJ
MRNRLVLTALFTAAVGALAACDPATGGSAAKTPSAAPASSTAPSAPATPTASASPDGKVAADVRATVPDFVGMGLQAAQDKAQDIGFYGLTSHDSLGRDRLQAFDRNWKVCGQNVKAGTSASTGTTLDFGSVKLDETCPDKEQAAPTAAGGKMPDFRGRSVKAARAALDSGTSITVNDASAEDRWVLMESNWKVCAQNPAAGTALKGQPVTLTAVKFGENCT